MESREKAILKEKILQYILKRNGAIGTDTIYEDLGKPVKSIEHFEDIVREMYNGFEKYFVFTESELFQIIGKTELTVEIVGSYLELDDIDREKIRSFNIAQEANLRNKNNLYIINDWKAKLAPWQYYTFWPIFIIALLTSAFSIYKMIPQEPAPEPTTENEQLEQIEHRMDYIEGTLIKEVDSLKSALQKANEAIAKKVK